MKSMALRAKFLGLVFVLFMASSIRADIAGLGVNVTGSWSVEVSVPGGRIFATVELTQTGNAVQGWLEPRSGERIPLSGALLSGRLILTTHPESRRLVAFDRCDVEAGGNRMKGAFYPGNGKIEFKRLRETHLSTSRRNRH